MTEKLNMSLDDIIRLNKKITPKGAGGIRRPTGAKPSKLGLNKAGKVDFKKAAKMRAALQIPAHRTPRPTSVQNVDAATRRLVNNLVEQALQKRLSQPARPLVPAPPLIQVVSKPRVPIKYDTENFFEEDEEEDVMEVPPPPMIVRRVITQSVAPKLSVPEAIQRIVRARTLPSRIVRVSAPSRPKKVIGQTRAPAVASHPLPQRPKVVRFESSTSFIDADNVVRRGRGFAKNFADI